MYCIIFLYLPCDEMNTTQLALSAGSLVNALLSAAGVLNEHSIDRGLVKNARVLVTEVGMRLINIRLLHSRRRYPPTPNHIHISIALTTYETTWQLYDIRFRQKIKLKLLTRLSVVDVSQFNVCLHSILSSNSESSTQNLLVRASVMNAQPLKFSLR